MLNEQIMIDTINRLLEAGIDEPTVISTLSDAGLSREEAIELIKKVKEKPATDNSKKEEPNLKEDIEPVISNNSEVKVLRNEIEAQAEKHDLHQTTTNSILDDHEERLEEFSRQIDEVKSNIPSVPQGEDSNTSFRLNEIEKKIEDVNAASKASLDLLGKILETNRKILTELEAKK